MNDYTILLEEFLFHFLITYILKKYCENLSKVCF